MKTIVRDQPNFVSLCTDTKALADLIDQVRNSVQGILEKKDSILAGRNSPYYVTGPTRYWLNSLIVQRLTTDGDRFLLDDFLKDVIELFKKNQIIIRIDKRRWDQLLEGWTWVKQLLDVTPLVFEGDPLLLVELPHTRIEKDIWD